MLDLLRRTAGIQRPPGVTVHGALHLPTNGNGQLYQRSRFAIERPRRRSSSAERVVRFEKARMPFLKLHVAHWKFSRFRRLRPQKDRFGA